MDASLTLPDINLYNWPDRLDTAIGLLNSIIRYAVVMFGHPEDRISFGTLWEGEDAAVNDLDAVFAKVNTVIDKYVPETERDMQKQEYRALVERVGTESNLGLANATYNFCARILPID